MQNDQKHCHPTWRLPLSSSWNRTTPTAARFCSDAFAAWSAAGSKALSALLHTALHAAMRNITLPSSDCNLLTVWICYVEPQKWPEFGDIRPSQQNWLQNAGFALLRHRLILGTTVFHGPRNFLFQSSHGICCFAAEMSRAAEFMLFLRISQISGNTFPNVCLLAV